MKQFHEFEIVQISEHYYKILGKNVPPDLEIRILIKNGKYMAESNYSKKPSITAESVWQPRSMPFDTEEKALENMLNFFESSNESYEKN
mgnify:CR=1 FL=1